MAFAAFMAEPLGRVIRAIGGLALAAVGIWVIGDWSGWILVAVGTVFFSAGSANVCVLSPFLRAPFNGREVLRRQNQVTS